MTQWAVGPQVTQVWTGGGPVLLANQDLSNTVTISNQNNVTIGAPNADLIPALGSIAYTGNTPLYAIAPAGTEALLAIAGGTSWAPSPADIAIQIATLGLAQDSTVAALPANIQQAGVPPFIPSLKSAQALQISPGASPDTLVTFSGGSGRLWSCHLSFALATNTGHAGTDQAYARLMTGSGITLTVVEVASSGTTGTDSGDSDLVFNGLPIAANDTIKLDVNNGATITGAIFRASAVVLYSMP